MPEAFSFIVNIPDLIFKKKISRRIYIKNNENLYDFKTGTDRTKAKLYKPACLLQAFGRQIHPARAELVTINKQMKIAITGASGFVGAALCRYFYKAGHEIIALGNQNNPNPGLLKIARYIKADISKVISEIEADVCIHTAGLVSDTDTYKNLIIRNVEGTLNVIEAAKNCSHFIHISSSSVYRFSKNPVREEDASIDTHLSDYGETNLLAEEIVRMNIPLNQKRLILRPRAIYGIGDQTLLPRLLKMIRGRFLFCPVRKEIQSSLTHIDNLGYAIELYLARSASATFRIYNISDDKPYFLKEIALLITSAIENRQLTILPFSRQLFDILLYINNKRRLNKNISQQVLDSFSMNSILDISKIRSELNYSPIRSLQNSCQEIANWVGSYGGSRAYLKKLSDAPWSGYS